MKEIIFFDVDDTLIDSNTHQIPESTKLVLLELAKYYYMGIATGRSFPSLQDIGLDQLLAWDIFVCTNGQIVFNKQHEVIVKHTIDPRSVSQVLDIAKQRKEPVLLAAPYWQRIGDVNSYMETAHAFFHIEIPPHNPVLTDEVSMMLVYDQAGSTYDAYRHIPGIDLLPGQSTYCDLVKAGFEKHIGIQEALKYLDISSYIAFGDSNNDLGMMKHARIGVAMGQGTKEVKALASFITKPVSEDGISYAVEQLSLL